MRYCTRMEHVDARRPHEVIASRVRALRKGRGWSAERLAKEMSKVGVPWERMVVTKLETGRRKSITVEELLALAYVLDVAPVYLLLPVDDERAPYAYTPDRTAEVWQVREWVRGHPYAAAPATGLGGVDRRRYLTEVPDVEITYPSERTNPLQTVKVADPDTAANE